MLYDIFPHLLNNENEPAVCYRDLSLTYQNLNQMLLDVDKAIDYKSCPQVIAIFMDRSLELVLSTLSIFLSSHIFCIIDVNTPQDTLVGIINELGTNLIFTDKKQFNKLTDLAEINRWNTVVFSAQEDWKTVTIEKNICFENVEAEIDNDDCSHIIYTSGSTNVPKGIISSRKALLNFIKWEKEYLRIQKPINVAQMSTPWFDPYMRDIFLPLSCGGCICLPTKREYFDPKAFFDFAEDKKVDLVHIVPTLFRQLFLNSRAQRQHNIKNILLAGEMIYGADIKKYFDFYNSGTLFNLYGPSETTLAKFCYKISAEDTENTRIKVGKPIDNTFFKVVDSDGAEVSAGEIGEVIIYTKDCSYGYLNNPQKNMEAFNRENEYVSFRTSDTGFVHEDGNLELVGRLDSMHKVYGQKVYPEEIEAAVMLCSQVKKCRCDIQDNQIKAIIEVMPDFEKEALQKVIANLSEYKRPRRIYVVGQVPTNKNGKVDRRASIDEMDIIEKFVL
ncbi:MAG: AMP-binding protein [Oscillospiraceae bacterium]|nr:AMP-binding protein [Oscillospiraceae bacterium]